MENSFFPRTWRSKELKMSEEELNLPLGQFDLLRIERKFIEVISDFIKRIFNYEQIQVSLIKKEPHGKNVTGYSSSKLESDNGHTKFHFAAKLFNNQFYEFEVSNIPATTESRHIHIFFRVLRQYLHYFYQSIQDSLPIEDNHLKASSGFIAKSDIWLYNIERTIIVEFIYNLFNTFDEEYTSSFKFAPSPLKYDLDLVNSILDFAYELSTKKVENKEIYCGFIFHDKIEDISQNSVRKIKFKEQFDFGDFGQLKNYLEVSNGQNIFFNVTKSKITHLLITKDKLNEIYINPIGNGKTFLSRPLILSIQGNGKIYFLEGRSDKNRTILQIINSKPIIRDNNFIENFIYKSILDFTSTDDDTLKVLSKWIMSLSQKKHGTSIIFSDITKEVESKLVKTVRISFDQITYLSGNKLRYDLSLLDSIINPDGAIILNTNLIPTHISTILPIGQSKKGTSGGARHNSVSNFSKKYNCLGIVISEDGPITIFKNGNKLIKF